MSEVKRNVQLEWKDHSVDLQALLEAIKAVCPNCCGMSAGAKLEVHLTEDDQEQVDLIEALWADCDDPENAMCQSYTSMADRAAEREAARASAVNKLKALGLSDAEIAALSG